MKYLITLSFSIIALSTCSHQQVSYQNDIKPIINDRCLTCHIPPNGSGYKKTGLLMSNYQELMHGSVYGPVIIPGDSQRSVLNMLVEGRAGNVRQNLHENDNDLTEDEIEKFKYWVEQGAREN